ncbi:MAG: HAMP domain-containing protein, partial [Spirochaetia bacterium]|nr:HAMP domain-containing protein [Spirochaetia bacterium]
RDGQGIRFTKTLYNDRFMTDHNIKKTDVERLHTLSAAAFQKSFAGAVVVQNMSPGFSMPLLGMSMPSASGRNIIVLYIDPAQFLKTFKASGITLTFLVGDTGDVIAHPEQEMVMSRTNLADSEIVKQMLESRSNNQQVSFKDKAGKRFIGNFKKLNFAGLGVISTVPEDEAFQAVYRIRYRNFLIMVIVVVIAIFIVYFFSKTITVPIRRLVGATKQVEEGNYNVSLRAAAGDEIGLLTNSFVNMALGLEERQKMKDALGKFTNPKIAEMVLSGQLKLGGDRKNAAVFFSDLRGFTAMSEAMEPEEVVEFLNEYFTGMVACVDRTNGVVDKFIGDAIMAHWGALFSEGNDTENAVNAALQMRQNLIDFNSRGLMKSVKKKPHAQFGCGINTGPVISGQIGSESRLDYTVIGDTVNLASRIEALNKPFGTDVLISQDSYNVVKDTFDVIEMPAIKVKGKSEAQVIYCVMGRKDDPSRPKTLDELRARIGVSFSGAKPTAEALDGEGEVKYEIIGEKDKGGK